MKINELRNLLQSHGFPTSPKDQEQLYELMRQSGIEPGDFYQDIEMTDKFVNTHRDISFVSAPIHLHSHDFFELLCCRNSCGMEYLVGTQRYKLQKGDILFVSPGVSHCPIFPEVLPEPYERDVLWISKEYSQYLLGQTKEVSNLKIPTTNLIRTAGTPWEFLADQFHSGVEEAERKDFGWELMVLGNTAILVSNMWRALQYETAHKIRTEAPDLLDRVMAYIEEHLSEKITLADVAKHFYVSESTISHLFQRKMGVSFYRCVTQRRLISAKELLRSQLSLEAISEQVGFSDYSAFFRAFKREYSVSPKQYRKLLGGTTEYSKNRDGG